MATKKHQMAASLSHEPSQDAQITNWNKCIICQTDTDENLQCPAESRRTDQGAGYITFSENLARFHELDSIPVTLDIRRLDEGKGVRTTLEERHAKWHKSCRIKFNTTKLQRAEKRECPDPEKTSSKFTRTSNEEGRQKGKRDLCFFCDEPASASNTLHRASTFRLDARVRKCSLILQDERLIAKLSAGDMVAQDALYHARCLAALYKKASTAEHAEDKEGEDETVKINHGLVLAELISYIEESKTDEAVSPVFKLADLSKLYSSRLQELGVAQSSRVNSTHLKNRILANFPDLKAYKEGRDILLAFDEDIGSALTKVCEKEYDDEAITLAKAAQIVRRYMLEKNASFTGSFDSECQTQSVPQTLLALVAMIHEGPSIKCLVVTDSTVFTSTTNRAVVLKQLCHAEGCLTEDITRGA